MKTIFAGTSRMPYGNTASDVRLESFALLCKSLNHDVIFLNRYSSNNEVYHNENYMVIETGGVHKSKRTVFSIMFFLYGIIKEFNYIISISKQDKNGFIQVYSGHYIDFLFYKLICIISGYRFIYHYVEFRSKIKRKSLYHTINGWLCDKLGPKLWDGVISISYFLNENAKKQNKSIVDIIIPPICDYNLMDNITVDHKEDTLLFCGSVGYRLIIDLIAEAYSRSLINESYTLKMVLSGNMNDINSVKEKYPFIEIYTSLPYDNLIKEYKKAKFLLIPLRETIQDIARFPNKVCEYAASHSVIITTKFGEPARIFKDMESALICDDFSQESLMAKFDWILKNSDKIESISDSSYKIGRKHFDISSYVSKFNIFCKELQ